jgi:hypothetical protein
MMSSVDVDVHVGVDADVDVDEVHVVADVEFVAAVVVVSVVAGVVEAASVAVVAVVAVVVVAAAGNTQENQQVLHHGQGDHERRMDEIGDYVEQNCSNTQDLLRHDMETLDQVLAQQE